MNRKTVRRLQREAARRAEIHHNNEIIGIEEAAVQCDELYAEVAGSVSWLGAAIGVQSLMILAIAVYSRSQALADRLAANLWVHCAWLPALLKDRWKAYFNAFLRCFGRLYQPRRTGRRGREKGKRLKFPDRRYYAQVIKMTPAMAAGLAKAHLTYPEYITMPVFEDLSTEEKVERRIQEIQSEEMKRAVKRSMRPPSEEETVWKERAQREAT